MIMSSVLEVTIKELKEVSFISKPTLFILLKVWLYKF
jgi:hypothetical protein